MYPTLHREHTKLRVIRTGLSEDRETRRVFLGELMRSGAAGDRHRTQAVAKVLSLTRKTTTIFGAELTRWMQRAISQPEMLNLIVDTAKDFGSCSDRIFPEHELPAHTGAL